MFVRYFWTQVITISIITHIGNATCRNGKKVVKIGLFTDDHRIRGKYSNWIQSVVDKVSNMSATCVEIVDLSEKSDSTSTICSAISEKSISALISIASCSSLYQLIASAYESNLAHFVLDQNYCVQIPIKNDKFRLELFRTKSTTLVLFSRHSFSDHCSLIEPTNQMYHKRLSTYLIQIWSPMSYSSMTCHAVATF